MKILQSYIIRLRRSLLFCLLGTVFSCLSYTEVQQAETTYVERLFRQHENQRAIEVLEEVIEDDPLLGFVLLEKFIDVNLITQEQKENLHASSVEAIDRDFLDLIEQKEYEKALVQYQNLAMLDKEPDPDILRDIYVQLIRTAAENKNHPKVTRYSTELMQVDKSVFMDSDFLSLILSTLTLFPDSALIRQLCNDEELNVSANALESTEICTPQPPKTIAQILESTFVVDIDQGIVLTQQGSQFVRELGSAFFITRDGYALTNYHVIQSQVDPEYEGKSEIKARLQQDDFGTRPAQVIGYNKLLDLALIKVQVRPEHIISIPEQEAVNEGDSVLAVGSPFGLTNSVSSGIISSKERRLLGSAGVLQVDAPVNPGNSGGPLLNDVLQLLGVVFSKIENQENLNFAIPASLVSLVLPSLFEGETQHNWLGIGVSKTEQGYYILYISPGTPAERSNLHVGDIITHINDEKLDKIVDIQEKFLNTPEKSLQKLKILRDGNEREIFTYTGKREENPFQSFIRSSALYKVFPILMAVHIEVVKFGSKPNYRISKVLEDGQADYLGMKAGDILRILRVQQSEDERFLHINFNIRQQKSVYLSETLVLTLELSTRNFI